MSEEIKYDLNMQVSTTDNYTWLNRSQTLLIDGDSSDEAENAAMILSNHSALTEPLHLKELECEQLAKDKAELVDSLAKIVAQKDKYTPTQQGKGVRVRRIREFDLNNAKQLLERLG